MQQTTLEHLLYSVTLDILKALQAHAMDAYGTTYDHAALAGILDRYGGSMVQALAHLDREHLGGAEAA